MHNDAIENFLILQGGGSLGASGCGVFKDIANNNIKIDRLFPIKFNRTRVTRNEKEKLVFKTS